MAVHECPNPCHLERSESLASTAYEERFLAWGSKLLEGEPLQNYEIDLERIYNIADVERRGVDDAGTR
jgi:hypothetical protein